jgi:hypothetical protein
MKTALKIPAIIALLLLVVSLRGPAEPGKASAARKNAQPVLAATPLPAGTAFLTPKGRLIYSGITRSNLTGKANKFLIPTAPSAPLGVLQLDKAGRELAYAPGLYSSTPYSCWVIVPEPVDPSFVVVPPGSATLDNCIVSPPMRLNPVK